MEAAKPKHTAASHSEECFFAYLGFAHFLQSLARGSFVLMVLSDISMSAAAS